MLRNILLQQGYQFTTKEPRKTFIKMIWSILSILFIAANIWLFFQILSDNLSYLPIPYIDFHIYVINIAFIIMPFIYFISKDIIISVFCHDKKQNIEMKSADTGIPTWAFREAFKTWQILFIYFVPAFVIYSSLILFILMSGGNINLFILAFVMAFFVAYDLTLVLSVLFVKIIYKPDYVGINKHAYSLTLYYKTYIVKRNPSKQKKPQKAKFKFELPDLTFIYRLSRLQKICAVLIGIACLSAGVFIYSYLTREKPVDPGDFETYLEYCDATKPVIKKHEGDPFASPDVTSDGFYSGFERLAENNLIYCNDDDSVIYFNDDSQSLTRLDANGKSERLCVHEECRVNPDEICGHMPEFIKTGSYSNGILYGIRQYSTTNENYPEINILNVYIIRYNTDSHVMDKLIEFKMNDDNVYINKMMIYGRYLYSWFSAEGMMDLSIVRIDLEEKNSCVVYSEDSANKEHALALSLFNENNVSGFLPSYDISYAPSITPSNGILYQFDLDMKNMSILMELEYITTKDENDRVTGYITPSIKQYDIYNGDIYYTFSDSNNNQLYRYNIKSNKKQQLSETAISEFYIEGEYIYYTVPNLPDIYRTKLDGGYIDADNQITHIDFVNSTSVYQIQPEYALVSWGVKGDNIYVILRTSGKSTFSRVNINTGAVTDIFG